jgi:hypothetical protein
MHVRFHPITDWPAIMIRHLLYDTIFNRPHALPVAGAQGVR